MVAGIFRLKGIGSDSSELKRMKTVDQMEGEGLKNFTAKSLEGGDISPALYPKKLVIVHFWASWCGPCLTEFPSLISLIEEMNGEVQLIAVSGDDNTADILTFLKAFPKAKNPNIHIVWDSDKALSRMYEVDRLPESFLANRDLKLVKKIVGSINWHSQDTLDYLKSL